MKICSIRIKGYQQFDDLYLDFTNPETGEPVDKVCFIGRNGTGKSTLLRIILDSFNSNSQLNQNFKALSIKLINKDYSLIFINFKIPGLHNSRGETIRGCVFNPSTEDEKALNNYFSSYNKLLGSGAFITFAKKPYLLKSLISNEKILLQINSTDILIYSPSESTTNNYLNIEDVPLTSLDDALQFFREFPYNHEVSDQTISLFWKQLIYLIKKRENEREEYENLPENLNKTKKQLIEEFDEQNPKILKKLAELWNKILDKAGLEFDYESASNPIQLNDNLKAYIKLKSTGEKINYNQLSTGIRNFIFRIGHIYSLYFNREIKKGFLLVDEPENSLFPDFLYELIDIYQEITTDKNGERNTQMFFATHNPIIAAQFEPYERILLEWDENGHVQAFKGKAPVGDDPNDVLRQDFRLDHLMGKKGQEVWQEYLDLKKQLRHTKNGKDKDELISKISKMGQLYNFED